MTVPGLREWLFSVKTFAAALIAFYLALSVDLDRPYWSIATVYIVSQPLSGTLLSKGLYRMAGTLLGAAAAIAMVPALVDAPVLLSAALALWSGICLYLSLCDRTPRSYVFMLAGYTAAIIGFPSVDQPGTVFQTAGARVEEIGLGILCATAIGMIVFPRSVVPVLMMRLDTGFAAAGRWALAALGGQPADAERRAARQAIAGSASEIHTLIADLAYDVSPLQSATRLFATLGDRMIYLLPVLLGVTNRVAALRDTGNLSAELQALLARLAAWLHAGPDRSAEVGRQLRSDLAGAAPAPGSDAAGSDAASSDAARADAARPDAARPDWATILQAGLLARLVEFVDVLQDVGALRRQVQSGRAGMPPLALAFGAGPDGTRHRDRAMALLSGFAASLAIGLICAFWIASEWPEGALAALMAAVLSSFFAAQDDPVPALLNYLCDTAIGIVIAAVYLFVVLPQVEGFEVLALVLAPVFLPLGALIAVPATFLRALCILLNMIMMMTLTETYSADFATFLNTGLALGFGVAAAAVVTALVRSVGVRFMARRLEEACRLDVARAALQGAGSIRRSTLAALLLDRIAELTPRLAAESDAEAERALLDLGVGLNVVDLQHDCAALSSPARDSVRETLAALGAWYAEQAPGQPGPALLASLDRTIAAVAGSGVQPARRPLMELLFIRQAIFPGSVEVTP